MIKVNKVGGAPKTLAELKAEVDAINGNKKDGDTTGTTKTRFADVMAQMREMRGDPVNDKQDRLAEMNNGKPTYEREATIRNPKNWTEM